MTYESAPMSADLMALVDLQRQHAMSNPMPTAAERQDRISRLIDLVADNADALADAMSADFGNRSRHESMIADIAGTLTELKHARDHLAKWMKPEKAKVDTLLALFGAKARIEYQPLGIIGIVSPWNFPVYLSIGPMGEAFAAGNSVMLKLSEITPRTSDLLRSLLEASFSQHEVAVVTGGVEIGQAFAALPLDHILFTGATSIGPSILHSAADNMVPVTLELGGKSPAIIAPSADMSLAVARIASGKMFNAGQVCLAPDYVMVPRARMQEFADAIAKQIAKSYPTLSGNPDFTHIVTDRQLDRLRGLVEEARQSGANVVEINPANEDLSGSNEKILPPTLIVDASPDLGVMQQEIFGPVLPILPYDSLEDVAPFVRSRAHPLALYVFAKDTSEQDQIISATQSGGVCINDTIMHSTQQSLPFGGVGASGTGAYHGIHGFRRFSHARSVYKQINADGPFKPLRAPFGSKFAKAIAPMLRK